MLRSTKGFSERVKDINALDALAAEHTVVVYDRRSGQIGWTGGALGGEVTRGRQRISWIICESIPPMYGRLHGVFGSAGIWCSLPGKSSRSAAPLAGGRISLEGKRLGAVPASLRFHQGKRSQSGCRARTDPKKFLVRSGVGPWASVIARDRQFAENLPPRIWSGISESY